MPSSACQTCADRKSTRLNSSHTIISYAVFCLKKNTEAVQPWDVKGYKIPVGTPSPRALPANPPAFPANLRKTIKGANYLFSHHIMAAAVEGSPVDFDNA